MILQDGFLMHDSLTFYAKAMSSSTNVINRVAYGEMLDGCKSDPERGIWFLSSHPC